MTEEFYWLKLSYGRISAHCSTMQCRCCDHVTIILGLMEAYSTTWISIQPSIQYTLLNCSHRLRKSSLIRLKWLLDMCQNVTSGKSNGIATWLFTSLNLFSEILLPVEYAWYWHFNQWLATAWCSVSYATCSIPKVSYPPLPS